MTDYRAEFDADVTFLNGGALQAQRFRIDVDGPDVTETALAAAFVRHLGLLMVDRVRLSAVRVFAEAHKGSRDTVPAPAVPAARRIVDLSHPIAAGMTTYPGLPGPEIMPYLTREASRSTYAPGVEFAIDRIAMVGNTGTYLDAPWHRYAEGADLAALSLESLVDLPTVVVHVADSRRRKIGVAALAAFRVHGSAVLLHTGWDRHWGTAAYGGPDAPYLTDDAARWLAAEGAALVGLDAVNIDDMADRTRPAHSALLAAGIPIVEHLTGLAELPAHGARLHAAPLAVREMGTMPVRVYAVVLQDGPD